MKSLRLFFSPPHECLARCFISYQKLVLHGINTVWLGQNCSMGIDDSFNFPRSEFVMLTLVTRCQRDLRCSRNRDRCQRLDAGLLFRIDIYSAIGGDEPLVR
jgi:hypothetical protein